jgi:hypothetical protein
MVSDVRQIEINIAEPLLSEPSSFDVTIATSQLKKAKIAR